MRWVRVLRTLLEGPRPRFKPDRVCICNELVRTRRGFLSGLGRDTSSVLVRMAPGLSSSTFLPDAPLFFAAPQTQRLPESSGS